MKNIRVFFALVMSLMVLLPSSSFFLSSYLTQLITTKEHNQYQLYYAVKKNNVAALNFSVEHEPIGSKRWLELITQLAKTQGEAAYYLGDWYVKKAEDISPIEKADAARNKAKMWFEQAIRLNSFTAKRKAQLALAALHFKQNNFLSAQTLLNATENLTGESLNNESIDAFILQINIAIALGHTEVVAHKVIEGQNILLQTAAGRLLLNDIKRFRVFSLAFEKNHAIISNIDKHNKTTCASSLQLFATRLKHLKQLEKLQLKFADKPLARFICLARPRYLPKIAVKCNDVSENAIQCNESDWQAVAGSVESRHIGLMVEKGGANVHLGIMYLDSQDSVDVFSHEISHLLGFVDEYPLTKLHKKCQQPQLQPFSHNIVVLNKTYYGEQKKVRQQILKTIPWARHISEHTPILQKEIGKKQTWRLGTPKSNKDRVGIFIAESCDNADMENRRDFIAYKPVDKRTQLRYFTSDFPKEYLTLLNEQPSHFLMPSYHYNMALALFQQGTTSEAKYWLEQAALWEDEPKRRAIIRQGGL